MKKDVLYYPHINFNDIAEIKAMSMFYDNIYRIVPDNVSVEDSEELIPLIEEGRVGKKINPLRYSAEASEEFLVNMTGWDAAALVCTEEEEQEISRINVDKTDERVRQLFNEVGFKDDGDWLHVPVELASNYMLYLATVIASKNNLSLMTKDWGAWTATNYFNVDGAIDEFITMPSGDKNENYPFALFSLIVDELTPVNISEIPSKKLLDFREKRKDEISNFRNCIFDLNEALQDLDAPEVKMSIVKEKIKALEGAKKDYHNSADIIKAGGIWKGFTMLGFPATVAFSALLNPATPATTCMALGGVIFGGMFHLRSTKNDLKKLRQESPASLLLDINNDFRDYTNKRGGGDVNFHAYNCMEEYIND